MKISLLDQTGLSQAEIDEILSLISDFPEIEKVTLFGSRAKGTYKRGSDIDLVISGKSVNDSITNELSYQLNEESTLPYYFDLLNLSDIHSSALLSHIVEHGVCLKSS